MRLLLDEQGQRAVLSGVETQLTRNKLAEILHKQDQDPTDPGSKSFGDLVKDGGEAFVRRWSESVLRFEKALLDPGASLSKHQRYLRKLFLAQQLLPEGGVKPDLPLFIEGDPVVVGHTMPYIRNLRSFQDAAPSWSAEEATQALLELHSYIERLHERGILLGEVNWQNFGFDRDNNFVAFDTVNYDFPGFPCGTAFRETIDPKLLKQDETIAEKDAAALLRERPYSVYSDWFGFRCITLLVFTGCNPWSGKHKFENSRMELRRPRVRALRGLSLLHPNVRLTSPAIRRRPEVLSDSLYEDLYRSFNGEIRSIFSKKLLSEMHWTICSVCGNEFASSQCPCAG